jgi:hypothetical protein
MKTLMITQHRSALMSLGLHSALLLMAFLPFAIHAVKKAPVELLLEIGYVPQQETLASGSEGLQARSPIYNDEPEPTTPQAVAEPLPVDNQDPVDEPQLASSEAEMQSDVTSAEASPVSAGEPDLGGNAETTVANGGGNGSPIEGHQDGGAMAGDGGGGDGLEGDGVITRKVIRRADISQAARVNGRVTLDICIDRAGKVTQVAYDPEKTTITDKDVIRQSSHLALGYRFEPRYTAPVRECGELTFIFRIDESAIAGL